MKRILLVSLFVLPWNAYAQDLEHDRLALIALYNSTSGASWQNKTGWNVPGTPGDNPCGWYGVTCNTAGDRVEELNLEYNGLKGSLPDEIGNLTALKVLSLDGSGIYDPVAVDVLYYGTTRDLTGDLPSSMGQLVNLNTLILRGNYFTGSIPASFVNLQNLTRLDLSCQGPDVSFGPGTGVLGGTLPDFSNFSDDFRLDILGQSYNFDAIVPCLPRLVRYDHYNSRGQQSPLNIVFQSAENVRKMRISASGQILSVEAGGNISDNVYTWYVNGNPFRVVMGDKFSGDWFNNGDRVRVDITNSLAPNYPLFSEEITITPLPVTLIFFKAENTDTSNKLIWKTTAETDNAGFEIEKSRDALNFESMGFVDGNGTTTEDNTYQFIDNNPYTLSYYRLKQLDHDGTFEYSKMVSVKSKEPEFAVYPNPAGDQLFLKDLNTTTEVNITNTSGKTLLHQKVKPGEAIPLNSLSNGLYLLKVGNRAQKIVIQK